jgi:hypothetical protein
MIVEIYTSELDFEDGELANFYHQLFFFFCNAWYR